MAIFTTTSNNNYFSSYIDIKAISTPNSPNSGVGRIFYNTSDSKLYLKKSNGTLVELGGGGAGTVTSASNIGSGSGWFKTLSGTDLQFKSLIAGSTKLSVTSNANDLTLDVAEANLTLSNIGGTIGNSKISDLAYSKLTSVPSTFAPSAHATSHKSGGSDAIKLDELAATTDITTLNATTSAHGLLPKLDNNAAHYLNGVGGWATPAGTGSSAVGGTSTQSGDASTKVFTIAHGLGALPDGAIVNHSSIDALGDFQTDVDATNITITYQVAPPSGTNNLSWIWMAV